MLGKYKGTYKYNKHPNGERVNTGTMFTLIISIQDGTTFSGTITDDIESGGTIGEGFIEGTIKNGRIEFIKQMPILTVLTKKGIRIEVQKKHKPIYYSGTLHKETFEGVWKIKRGMILNKFIIAFGCGTKGTWEMKKV